MLKMSEIYSKYKNLIDTIVFIFFWGIITWFLPMVALFGFRGAESPFNVAKVSFYYGFGIVAVILIIAGKVNQWVAGKNEKYFEKMGWFGSLINNWDMALIGWNPKNNDVIKIGKFNPFGWLKSGVKQFWIFGILFSIIGIFAVVTNTFLTDLPHITTQQVYHAGEAILEVEPSGVEIFGLVFFVGLNMFFWRWIQRKNKWDDSVYWAIAIPTSWIVGIIYGLPLHFFAYPNSDKALIGVAFFWFTATTLILLFGSLIIVWLMKDLNNLFNFLNKSPLYSDEKIVVITGIIIGFMVLLTIAYFIIKGGKKKTALVQN